MPKYLAIEMTKKGKILKTFNSRSNAQKWRTKFYKKHPRKRVGILSERGWLSSKSY